MSQQIIQTSDFISGSTVHNIQGIIYRGEGSPVGQKISTQLGAVWIDITTGNLWTATSISVNTGWIPFSAQTTPNITVSSDIQEGDLVGIYGAGAWTTSANLNTTRSFGGGTGMVNSGVIAGGLVTGSTLTSSSEIYNGTTWSTSGVMTASKQTIAAFGSQSAGVILGGLNSGPLLISNTETFNGAVWAAQVSGALSQTKAQMTAGGTVAAGWIAGGTTLVAGTNVVNITEIYNGFFSNAASSANLNVSKANASGGGSQSAAWIAGGNNATTVISTTELFNGAVWLISGTLNQSKQSASGSGTQTNGFITGGFLSGVTSTSITEIFNGTTWTVGTNLNASRQQHTGSGAVSAAWVAGGSGVNGNTSEVHSQNIYRKLSYSSLPQASNIGMAYNVSTTNFTAQLCQADIPNTRLAGQNFFGFNKYTHENSTIVLESTRAISSVAISGSQMLYTLGTSNTGVVNGMLLLVTGSSTAANNGLFPIVGFSGGTQLTVKNPNGTTQGASGTAQLVYANRLSGLVTSGISVTGGVATITFSSVGGVTSTPFQRLVKVGGNIYIPYASTSGASGSQYNWGTYRITGVGAFTVTCNVLNVEAITETFACSNVEYWAQAFTEAVPPQGSYVMGFNNRMGFAQRPMTDATNNYF